MTLPPLKNRLSAAVPFVRKGSFLADIGTDHAYLPITLALAGQIRGAVAADIAEKPLAIASANIRACGAEELVATCLSDGLEKIRPYAPDDISIFGMGGEMIVSILDAAPWTKNPDIRLILGPMTKTSELRGFLSEKGYAIIGETLSEDDGKIYQIICAVYDGKPYSLSPLEKLVGRQNLKNGGERVRRLLARQENIFRKIATGKQCSGTDTTYENAILAEIAQIRKERDL